MGTWSTHVFIGGTLRATCCQTTFFQHGFNLVDNLIPNHVKRQQVIQVIIAAVH